MGKASGRSAHCLGRVLCLLCAGRHAGCASLWERDGRCPRAARSGGCSEARKPTPTKQWHVAVDGVSDTVLRAGLMRVLEGGDGAPGSASQPLCTLPGSWGQVVLSLPECLPGVGTRVSGTTHVSAQTRGTITTAPQGCSQGRLRSALAGGRHSVPRSSERLLRNGQGREALSSSVLLAPSGVSDVVS